MLINYNKTGLKSLYFYFLLQVQRFNQMKPPILSFLGILISITVHAQPAKKISIPEYIERYSADAVKDMLKMGVPASITLSQAILESESGNSDLAREAMNHFGIKCHTGWTGDYFHKDDDQKDECFRKYNSVLESYDDHSRFLRERPRYAFLFSYEITDYKSWAHGLKKAGYATNPRYADLLIKLIEEHDLDRFDRQGTNMPVNVAPEPLIASSAASPVVPTSTAKTEILSRQKVNSNKVPYIIAGKGDTWYSLSADNGMRMWQILKYNDAGKSDPLKEGDIVYLKPKRGRPESRFHIVAEGENLRQIAQKYGIRLNRLYDKNKLDPETEITVGQKLALW
jgi:LysM repeat protein